MPTSRVWKGPAAQAAHAVVEGGWTEVKKKNKKENEKQSKKVKGKVASVPKENSLQKSRKGKEHADTVMAEAVMEVLSNHKISS